MTKRKWIKLVMIEFQITEEQVKQIVNMIKQTGLTFRLYNQEQEKKKNVNTDL